MTSALDRLRASLAGRYTIDRELGRGGMATVYLAEDVKHHRLVALKLLRPDLAAALGTDRFLQEIDIAAHLQHPNVLPLYDSGEADGLLRATGVGRDRHDAFAVDAEVAEVAREERQRSHVVDRDREEPLDLPGVQVR